MDLRLAIRPVFNAGNTASLVVFLSLASTLVSCGSRQDLVIGSDDYSVLKRDDFDGPSIDLDYWELASHTFDPNLAWFSPANAKLENGMLVLSITAVPAPARPAAGETPKAYSAAEIRTRAPFLYGRFRTRARLAAGTGVVSSFWGFYDRYAMSSGAQLDNQIVIESGIAKGSVNHDFRFAVKVPTAGVDPTGQPSDVDPTLGFHVLGYDWTPTEVRFFLDGESQLVVAGDAATQLTQYERLVLSAYPSGATWLSDFDPKQLPLTAEFDWIEIAAYTGPRRRP